MDSFGFGEAGFDVFPDVTPLPPIPIGPTPDLSGSIVTPLIDLSGSSWAPLTDLSGSTGGGD